jgi:response regulator RpfG family c-di-GMP phosphodiesterase
MAEPNGHRHARHVLLVEDDEEDYEFTKDLFEELAAPRHELFRARDYQAAISATRYGTYDVCFIDYRLGGAENGIDLAHELIADGHKMPIIFLTGTNDREIDEKAARAGAADFLVKGEISAAILERAIRYAIQSHAALREVQSSYRTTVRALAAALELRDDQTREHATRVTELALRLVAHVDPELAREPELEYGFLLHDIGKIGVSDAVLLKPGPLDPDELERMQRHVSLGQGILAEVPYLNGVASEIAATHHERWDGTGYPNGLRGDEIPVAARIFSIVDAFDAITNDRPYRSARSVEHALDEIGKASGTQFDPAIAAAFIRMMTTGGARRAGTADPFARHQEAASFAAGSALVRR